MKKIASTLEGLLDNPLVSVAMDRSQPIDDVIEEVANHWKADLENRKPAPAYRETMDGFLIYTGQTFDMFTFMNALADRKAVINIPDYKNLAPKTIKTNEKVVSDKNRHGPILGVIGNKKALSFNIRIKDYNVIQYDAHGNGTVGAPRDFKLVDYSGKLYNGWKKGIEFTTNMQENKFLDVYKLRIGKLVPFEGFVHPNLAFSFYGSPYLIAKIVGLRGEEEASFYRKLAKDLKNKGVKLPERFFAPRNKTFKSRKKKVIHVNNLEAVLFLPKFAGEYPIKGMTETGDIKEYVKMPTGRIAMERVLRYSRKRAKFLSYKACQKVTAPTRAVELSYFENGFTRGVRNPGNEIEPGWDKPKWIREYRIPRGKIRWNALDFGNGIVHAYRLHKARVEISA